MVSDFLAALEPLLLAAGVQREVLLSGLETLQCGAVRLAADVTQAESEGVSLVEATKEGERFATMHRVHCAVLDILTLELPPELQEFALRVLAIPQSHFEPLRLWLARATCDPDRSRSEQAIARFALFEAVRLNLLVATWGGRGEFVRSGMDDDALDRTAEGQVAWLLENASLLQGPEPVRPLHVLLAGALGDLCQDAAAAVAWVSRNLQQQVECRARLEELLADTSPRDALLIRNYFQPAWQEQRLPVERLVFDHPLILAGTPRNTLDQRLRRQLRTLERRQSLPRRRNPALIDLLLERGA